MDVKEIQKQILESDEFVLEEIKNLQYLYNLQQVIRNDLKRSEYLITESVPDHLYGMMVLVNYFLPLEDVSTDKTKIYDLLLWHDSDEIETGDIIGYLKTDADRKKEAEARNKLIKSVPESLQQTISGSLEEYGLQESIEARFVKAIDKIEVYFQMYNENGKKLFHYHKATEEQSYLSKIPYTKEFKYIHRFIEVFAKQLRKEGFFWDYK